MPDTPGNRRPRLSVQPGWEPAVRPGRARCVYLVGAGPGDPELMTVRAARLLEIADAVFHDALVPQAILALAGPAAELVSVGHRAGGSKPAVGPVAREMADRANRGKLVVRLKGGDPFLFGRGAEEAAALLEAGVAFEVVPGVSSALAGPAAAGIPVTHRGLAGSLTIVAGHESEGEPERVRWDTLAVASDTLVVLMGVSRLRQLAARIIAAGRSEKTPAAVVMAATRPEQRQVVASLGGIAEAARTAGIAAPAVLVVGEVVLLAEALGGSLVTEVAAAAAQSP
jgi:uroporphyrin-III C-methyltransferase